MSLEYGNLLPKNGMGPLKCLSVLNEVSYLPIQSKVNKRCIIKLTKMCERKSL